MVADNEPGVNRIDGVGSLLGDAEDVLRKAARFSKDAAQPASESLETGSDVEIADRVAGAMRTQLNGNVVYCEGDFVWYNGIYWEAVPSHEMRRLVHKWDRARTRGQAVKLSKGRIDSILTELGAMLAQPSWFAERRVGINCQNGFVEVRRDGTAVLLPHDPEHRQRHVLPGEWRGPLPLEGSMLERLLDGCFKGDEDGVDKRGLMGDLAGSSALGCATQWVRPKAVVLLGRGAENGKSQILYVLRGLLPPTAVTAIPPGKFSDQTYLIKVAGKLLNTSDELGTSEAISSDIFKHLVTGNPVTARDLYRSMVDFRAIAQHVFACNQLPSFRGGMDRGVMRRLLVVEFNRTIPLDERVADIGERVVKEEMDLVLSWAIQGAQRMIARGGFDVPPSSARALMEWAQMSDPVQAWLATRVVQEPGRKLESSAAYADFSKWCRTAGYRPEATPAINAFSQRLQAEGLPLRKSGLFRGFYGVRVRTLEEEIEEAGEWGRGA